MHQLMSSVRETLGRHMLGSALGLCFALGMLTSETWSGFETSRSLELPAMALLLIMAASAAFTYFFGRLRDTAFARTSRGFIVSSMSLYGLVGWRLYSLTF